MKKLMNYLIVTTLFASLLGCTNEPEVIETPPVEPVVVDLVEPVVDEPVVNEIVVDEPVNNTYDISNIDISIIICVTRQNISNINRKPSIIKSHLLPF